MIVVMTSILPSISLQIREISLCHLCSTPLFIGSEAIIGTHSFWISAFELTGYLGDFRPVLSKFSAFYQLENSPSGKVNLVFKLPLRLVLILTLCFMILSGEDRRFRSLPAAPASLFQSFLAKPFLSRLEPTSLPNRAFSVPFSDISRLNIATVVLSAQHQPTASALNASAFP